MEDVAGYIGNFSVKIRKKARYVHEDVCNSCAECVKVCPVDAINLDAVDQTRTTRVDAVIFAAGTELYDPSEAPQQSSYTRSPNVVTALEFERLISASGSYDGTLRRPSDGAPARRLAWLQCVGSRNRGQGRDYCSSICCMFALKEAVLAHELGHFKRRHVLKRLLAMAGLSLLGLALLGWLMQQPWFYAGLGVGQAAPVKALLLFLMVAPVFSVFFEPIGSYLSRRHEFQADDYAIEQASGRSLIQALVKLYRDNASTLTPDPLFSLFHDSHPPAPVRIDHISAKIAPVANH